MILNGLVTHKKEHMIIFPKSSFIFLKTSKAIPNFLLMIWPMPRSMVYSLIIIATAQQKVVDILCFQYMVNKTIICKQVEKTCHVSIVMQRIKHLYQGMEKNKLM